jgi:enoyl-CoA hydratase
VGDPMIDFEIRGRVAVITLNRPEARNALSRDGVLGLEAAVERLEADAQLRVGILAGAPPAFCAGADLKMIAAGRQEEFFTERGGWGGFVRLERVKPVIAAVDGAAVGGGTELVLACDLVVASTAAYFGVPEVTRGLVPAAGALHRLLRKLPENLAMECLLTGAPITAETAAQHRLVNELCAPGEALESALELAERIAANPPVAVQESLRVARSVASWQPVEKDAWTQTAIAVARVLATDEVVEGVQAFIEKRPRVDL